MPPPKVKIAIYQAIDSLDWSQRSVAFKLSQKVQCEACASSHDDRSSVHRILNDGVNSGEIEKYPIDSGFGYRLVNKD